ncbi:MAG: bis(5'-nucleosyl)-tetraphosphatase (symmetrical) YqeK [Actinomycetes bacterium]|jgi:predicted HD superfamily hydrolase involved in NAD metabolism|nr:bis(5'-nucleosyl)-tetraphosphatase (symmetrical) YqeK [Actinomycetes bacterium]
MPDNDHRHEQHGAHENDRADDVGRPYPNPQTDSALFARIDAALIERLDDYGYRHTQGTAAMARTLAEIYGTDPDAAYLAALLHDWDRCVSWPVLIERARARGMDITDEVLASPAILHAHTGADDVARTFPEIPDDVIDAIRRHTVGVADMRDLDKIIYVADMIEPTRTNPAIDNLREMVGTVDLDALFVQAYQRSMMHLVLKQKVMHPETTAVWNALMLRLNPPGRENPNLKA